MTPESAIMRADVVLGLGGEVAGARVGLNHAYLVSHDLAEASSFCRQFWRTHTTKLAIVTHPEFYQQHREACDVFYRDIELRAPATMINQMTVEATAEQHAINFCRNLRRLPDCGWATSVRLEQPVPAFIISAGPGLDLNGHLLRDAVRRGLCIAVNTSGGAMRRHGVDPDLVVCMEAKDNHEVRSGLHATPQSRFAFDMNAGPGNFTEKNLGACLLPHYDPGTTQTVLNTGGTPLAYGGNCVAAATALAVHMGCSPIVHVGASHAYLPGHGMYARGTPFQGIWWCEREGIIEHGGGPKQVPPIAALKAENWDKTADVTTTHNLWGFASWLIEAARHHPMINASEAGVHLDGMEHAKLEAVLARLPELDEDYRLPPVRRSERLARLVHGELDRLRYRVNEVRTAGLSNMNEAIHRAPIVRAWLVTESLRLRESGPAKPSRMVEALHRAAKRGAEQLLIAMEDDD